LARKKWGGGWEKSGGQRSVWKKGETGQDQRQEKSEKVGVRKRSTEEGIQKVKKITPRVK